MVGKSWGEGDQGSRLGLHGGRHLYPPHLVLLSLATPNESEHQQRYIFCGALLTLAVLGLASALGPSIASNYQRARLFYGLTDQRVIIVYRGSTHLVRALNLSDLNDVTLQEKPMEPGAFGLLHRRHRAIASGLMFTTRPL